MLDPLTALSLASAVVQLVDFGARLLDDSSQLYYKGRTLELASLKTITDDLIEVNGLLKSRPKLIQPTIGHSAEAEQALDKLVAQCTEVADDFISCLRSLDVEAGIGRWKSFLQALRTRWDLQKIREMERRMVSLRSELVFRILALLNTKSDSQLDYLDKYHADIVEVVSLNQEGLRSSLRDNAADLSQLVCDTEIKAKKRHDETIAAILTLQNGKTRVLTRRPAEELDLHQPQALDRETVLTLKAEYGPLNNVQVTVQDFAPVQARVLDCFYFRQIDHRFETVAQAHRKTCEWIYSDLEAEGKPWSNFAKWLEEGQGCYWINGKAGSGKSTLMKYIQEDFRTKQALSVWAGQQELVTASFFFWNLGSALQKSQEGLLRSLLHDILDQRRHLIPFIFPELCRAVAKLERDQPLSDPTLPELNAALRICFLIDGIDEYDEDYLEISELLASVSSAPHVKIVLSSRPIPACIEAFSGYPGLRLQDLTYDDMKLYVEDKLKPRLEARGGFEADDFVSEIVEKASGVFVWVILVVNSLLMGLLGMDRLADLRRRLDELPSDLTDLYSHMLQRIPSIYRQQASMLFQLVLQSIEVQPGEEMTALQLSFAEDDSELVTNAPIKEITASQETKRSNEVAARIRSRCCGLLEIQDRKYRKGVFFSTTKPNVVFLHKTVVEFLRSTSIWDEMLSLTAGTDFDPAQALLRSCVLLTKTSPSLPVIHMDKSLVWQSMQMCLDCSVLVKSSDLSSTTYLDELNRVMSRHWKRAWTCHSSRGTHQATGHWATAMSFFDIEPDSFLTLMVTRGLAFYINDKLYDSDGNIGNLNSLMKVALRCFILTWDHLSVSHLVMGHSRIVANLLEYGVDPNQAIEGDLTAWELTLKQLATVLKHRERFVQHFNPDGHSQILLNLMVCMIMAGADPNARIVYQTKRYRGRSFPVELRESALAIIERVAWMPQWWTESPPKPSTQLIIKEYQDRIALLLTERGAISRQWRDTELVKGRMEDATQSIPNHDTETTTSIPNNDNISKKKMRGPGKNLAVFFEAPLRAQVPPKSNLGRQREYIKNCHLASTRVNMKKSHEAAATDSLTATLK